MTMTIQEAIKTGKPFKRKKWEFYSAIKGITKEKGLFNFKQSDLLDISAIDVLAEDWEVKE